MSLRRLASLLAAGTGLLLGAHAEGAAADPFRPPEWRSPILSPDGRHVAALSGPESAGELWILSADTSAPDHRIPITPGAGHVADAVWTGSGELVVLCLDHHGGGGFWVLPRPDATLRPLIQQQDSPTLVRLLHPQPWAGGVVCIEGFASAVRGARPRNPGLDLLTVDTSTGRVVHSTQNPGDVVQWFADATGRARLAVAVRDRREELRIRDVSGGDRAWRTAESFDVVRNPAKVLALSDDGTRAWVSTRLGRDTRGVHELDTLARRFVRNLATEDRFDVDGPIFVSGNDPVAVTWNRLTPHTEWWDPRWAAVARVPEGDGGNQVRTPVSLSADGRRAVFAVLSDRAPTRYQVAERDSRTVLRWLPSHSTQVPDGHPRLPVEFAARDGQRLSAYLTRPNASAPAPLVLLIHGGPWTRDQWGWDPEAEFLASRGWAVLQVNYRGSSGFGQRFQEHDAGRWDGAPTTDLLDGIHWAVDQGIADPGNLVVVGASFGAYLARGCLTAEGTRLRCGVSINGVFDVDSWLAHAARTEPEFILETQRWRLLGETRPRRERPESWLTKLRCPLLLLQSTEDQTVPPAFASAVAAAARRSGSPVELEGIPGAGHVLRTGEETRNVWERVDLFLSRSPRSSPRPH